MEISLFLVRKKECLQNLRPFRLFRVQLTYKGNNLLSIEYNLLSIKQKLKRVGVNSKYNFA
ncbi:hypothetical protein J19TS1_41650 [Heyndrickxia oleronia]|nr:hypothetical protein J19TS1_41650 [Heyndrickxia oleronia]